MKIFLSCVSAQFKDCRDALASDLRAIGNEVRVQEDFQQGPQTLIEQLEKYISECDRVIALIGDAYGSEASDSGAPPREPARSYSQWEYCFASGERLDGSETRPKDRFVYFATPDCLRSRAVDQSDQHAERQRRFCEFVKATGKHWGAFDSVDQLCRHVLRDGWQMTERPPRKPRNLPYDSIGTLFKGRDAFLKELEHRLRHDQTGAAAITSKQAVHGLGGVGKTRLVAEYALQHQDDYSALLFVVADSPEALRRNLAALCGPLILNLPEQKAKVEEVQVAAVVRRLQDYPNWLLIIDNVDTPAAATEVERLLPMLTSGVVLITSRISDWSSAIKPFELDVLGEDDAVAFLLEKTEGTRRPAATDRADARDLARELDGLALALEQAGAFISKLHISIAEYLHRWRQRETKVREWHDPRLMNYPRSVVVTWDATFQQLDPPARSLLQTLCWFAPDAIPYSTLETDDARKAVGIGVELLNPAGTVTNARATDLESAVATLAGFSLLRWEHDHTSFSVHRLVMEVTRERIPLERHDVWVQVALVVLSSYLDSDFGPDDVRSWKRWDPLRAHVAAVTTVADALGISEPTGRLMNELGMLLKKKCLWHEAELFYRRALAIAERSVGADGPNYASCLLNLAHLLEATNRIDDAEQLARRSLEIAARAVGGDHHSVAIILNSLAMILKGTNRLSEAELLLRRALAILESSCGMDHPTVAAITGNLAQVLVKIGETTEAEELIRRALAIDETSVGSRHPNVATHLNNLAEILRETNRFEESEPLLRRALSIDEESYGPHHPEVASNLNNLAMLLIDTDRLEEAEPLICRALSIAEQAYGTDHPRIVAELNNLATIFCRTQRLPQAEPLLRRGVGILIGFERQTGHQHPSLRGMLKNYRDVLEALERPEGEIARIESLMRSVTARDD